jgi:hypothetical protein
MQRLPQVPVWGLYKLEAQKMHDRGTRTAFEARAKLRRFGPHAFNSKIWRPDAFWEVLVASISQQIYSCQKCTVTINATAAAMLTGCQYAFAVSSERRFAWFSSVMKQMLRRI